MENFTTETTHQWLDEITHQLKSTLAQTNLEDILVIGIHRGGVVIARELHEKLGLENELGELDISFYRDDFSQIGLHPTVNTTNLPVEIDDKTVVLVDDVLYSGRTVRAAMNEIFDYGRPARILLAVLIEREGHELPIRADVKAKTLALTGAQQVKLDLDDLSLSIQSGDGS